LRSRWDEISAEPLHLNLSILRQLRAIARMGISRQQYKRKRCSRLQDRYCRFRLSLLAKATCQLSRLDGTEDSRWHRHTGTRIHGMNSCRHRHTGTRVHGMNSCRHQRTGHTGTWVYGTENSRKHQQMVYTEIRVYGMGSSCKHQQMVYTEICVYGIGSGCKHQRIGYTEMRVYGMENSRRHQPKGYREDHRQIALHGTWHEDTNVGAQAPIIFELRLLMLCYNLTGAATTGVLPT
jgi:hypothetical protein